MLAPVVDHTSTACLPQSCLPSGVGSSCLLPCVSCNAEVSADLSPYSAMCASCCWGDHSCVPVALPHEINESTRQLKKGTSAQLAAGTRRPKTLAEHGVPPHHVMEVSHSIVLREALAASLAATSPQSSRRRAREYPGLQASREYPGGGGKNTPVMYEWCCGPSSPKGRAAMFRARRAD